MKWKEKLLLFLLCLPLLVSAQDKTITGTVLSEDNVPLVGATVTVRGTQRATITGSTGKFSIVAAKGVVLVVSYIGYQTTGATVGNENIITIILKAGGGDL